MILDANDIPDAKTLEADLCIVGGGAAGISLALQYIGTRIEVLLLESGGIGAEPETQALYAGSVADARAHSSPDRYRQRRFGGTTTIWGGRCMPFDDIDFEIRDYVPNSGWPFGREKLDAYYPRANRLCEAGEFRYTAEEAITAGGRAMIDGFTSPYFSSNTLERFSCPTDFAARYGHRLSGAQNIKVILHANVTHLRLDGLGGRLSAVDIRTLHGRRLFARAGQYVLATGGLEVARLLLASRDVQPNGVGNDHDMVGRFYMCHIAGTIGRIRIDRPLEAVHHGYEITEEGIYCRRRLALRADAQRALGVGNFIARLHHPRITDPAHGSGVLSLLYLARGLIPYEYAVRLHDAGHTDIRSMMWHIRNVVCGLPEATAFAWHMLRHRKLAERKFPSIIVRPKANLYSLDFHAEQQPNADSRVTLDANTDALGMQRLHIDWRYTQGDLDTVARSLGLLAAEFERTAVGELKYEPETVEAEMTRYGAYGGHHIGTARMSNDARRGVVDADCRVHGVSNLFIASAATFPTSSQANPTLTVVALSLRLAEHLRLLLRPLTSAPRTEVYSEAETSRHSATLSLPA